MLEDTMSIKDAGASEAASSESKVAPVVETGARWISLSAMCRLANVNCSSMASDVWRALVEVARTDGVPELGGRTVRMSLRTIRGVDRWCMNTVDAHASATAFNLEIQNIRRAEARNGGMRRGTVHDDWLDRAAVLELLGKSSDDPGFQQVWFILAHSKRDGRDPFLVDRVVRLKVLTVEWGRRLHMHRGDVELIGKVADDRFRDQFLQTDQIAAHLAQLYEVEHGRIAREIAASLVEMYERTGRANLDGIPVKVGAIPKRPPGVTTCLHVSSLPTIERAVCKLYDERFIAEADDAIDRGGVDEGFDNDAWTYRP
ncbi:hypothetical protein ACIQW5_18385 [Methylorubrum thiocyanatum]|uniref:hypothetical protein n=1 Tax=Methylorubrum thiocyanatum TaxID=47958 RepID=UPI00383BEC2A